MTNPLLELKKCGQSVWYDDLNRKLIVTGALQHMVDEDGVSGGTSNPSIFEKAISGTDAYDEHLRRLVDEGRDLPQIYDELTTTDVGMSTDVFRPIYHETKGADGFASLEVSPLIANDTQASIEAAKRLFAKLDRPNAMIKIPGTPEGLPAIEQCLADGVNINITLLFGVENYEQVAWAYVSALEKRWAAGKPINRIASVASFFVSRVDTAVDKLLEAKGVKDLQGKIAVANAKEAYQVFLKSIDTPRWKALAAKGATRQRPLWASTGTKNKSYSDVLYVEPLIGRDTVNTMPLATLQAFNDHGKVAETVTKGVDEARAQLKRLGELGIDLEDVCRKLTDEGLVLFSNALQKLLKAIEAKR